MKAQTKHPTTGFWNPTSKVVALVFVYILLLILPSPIAWKSGKIPEPYVSKNNLDVEQTNHNPLPIDPSLVEIQRNPENDAKGASTSTASKHGNDATSDNSKKSRKGKKGKRAVANWKVATEGEKAYKAGILRPRLHKGIDMLDVTSGNMENGTWQFNSVAKDRLELHWFSSVHTVCRLLQKFDITYIGAPEHKSIPLGIYNAQFEGANELHNYFAISDEAQADVQHHLIDFRDTVDESSTSFNTSGNTTSDGSLYKIGDTSISGLDSACPKSQLHSIAATSALETRGAVRKVTRKWRSILEIPPNVAPTLMVNTGLDFLTRNNIHLTAEGAYRYSPQGMWYYGSTMESLRVLFRKTYRHARDYGFLVLLHSLPPVNPNHDTFKNYEGKVNEVLGTLNARVLAYGKAEAFCVLDLFRPLMRFVNQGENIWKEDGITLKEKYYRLTVQWTFNCLEVCTKHRPALEKKFSWELESLENSIFN